MSALALTRIVKRYGGQTVIDGLNLAVEAGEFVSLLGPSGCGKTTLLRLIAGLASADGGAITVGGADLTRVPAHRRNIGVVFQNYALFPHLSVAENIAFGLKAQRVPRADIAQRVNDALASVRLQDYGARPISALSGGQQQRVAVARALATRPRLVLLDEPLSALDRKLREHMQIELRRTLRDAGITAIFVTHDQDEALVMSDRIAVMNHGAIEQFDTPQTLYAQPRTLFALNFVGLSGQISGRVRAADGYRMLVDTPLGILAAPAIARAGSAVVLAIRPESMRIGSASGDNDLAYNRLHLTVQETIYLGARRLIYFAAPPNSGDRPLVAELAASAGADPQRGSVLEVSWPITETLPFAAGGTP